MKKEEGEHKEGEHHKKHLHEIRTTAAEDGSYVHHHTYKAKKEDDHTEPERQNVATSATPDEAGEHVAEQMGMNEQPAQQAAAPDPNAQAAPDAGDATMGQ